MTEEEFEFQKRWAPVNRYELFEAIQHRDRKLAQKAEVLAKLQARYNRLASWARERGGDIEEITSGVVIGNRVLTSTQDEWEGGPK